MVRIAVRGVYTRSIFLPSPWVGGPVSLLLSPPSLLPPLPPVCLCSRRNGFVLLRYVTGCCLSLVPCFQLGVRCVSADDDAFTGTPGWRAAIEGVNGTVPTPSSETTLSTYFEVRSSRVYPLTPVQAQVWRLFFFYYRFRLFCTTAACGYLKCFLPRFTRRRSDSTFVFGHVCVLYRRLLNNVTTHVVRLVLSSGRPVRLLTSMAEGWLRVWSEYRAPHEATS